MKALTVLQPWASLIAIGAKRIETRSWFTSYRGPLAIHAGKNEKFLKTLLLEDEFWHPLCGKDIPLGCVIAIATVEDCLPTEAYRCLPGVFDDYPELDTAQERSFGDFSPGRWAWVLTDVKPLVPVPAKGAQGLWEWGDTNPYIIAPTLEERA